MIIKYKRYSCQNNITIVQDKIYCQWNDNKILCEMLRLKI